MSTFYVFSITFFSVFFVVFYHSIYAIHSVVFRDRKNRIIYGKDKTIKKEDGKFKYYCYMFFGVPGIFLISILMMVVCIGGVFVSFPYFSWNNWVNAKVDGPVVNTLVFYLLAWNALLLLKDTYQENKENLHSFFVNREVILYSISVSRDDKIISTYVIMIANALSILLCVVNFTIIVLSFTLDIVFFAYKYVLLKF